MAEICCDVVSPKEASMEVSELSPRTARRRRMQIRRSRCLGEAEATEEPDRKRQRMSSSPPPPATPPHLCSTTRLFGNVSGSSRSSSSSDSEPTREAGGEPAPPAAEPPPSGASDAWPKYGTTSVCGRRRDMEDAVSVRPEFSWQASKHHFFGVYDGHGCSHVAASCKNRMHEMVAEELDAAARGGAAHLSWQEIMENSFSRMDAEVGKFRADNNKISSCRCEAQTRNSDHVGSTAVVAVVGPQKIVVANCGDSRAVLCRRGVPIPLSDDHKPDRPDELRRIEEAGGRVIYWDGARVLGVLAMSRAIGDSYLKPFVISEPEVTVTERSDDDECLILASDGLWDVLTNEMACDIARMCLRSGNGSAASGGGEKGPDKACSDAAMLLTKVALARQSADNVSVVVVDLRR